MTEWKRGNKLENLIGLVAHCSLYIIIKQVTLHLYLPISIWKKIEIFENKFLKSLWRKLRAGLPDGWHGDLVPFRINTNLFTWTQKKLMKCLKSKNRSMRIPKFFALLWLFAQMKNGRLFQLDKVKYQFRNGK